MPRPRAPLPEGMFQCYSLIYSTDLRTGFEEDNTGKLVRCLICSETDPHGKLGGWIARTSLKSHANSDGHATQVMRKAEQDAQKTMEESQRKRLNEGPSAHLTSIFSQPTSSRRTGMFDNLPRLDGLGDNWDDPPYDSPSHSNPELIVPTGVTLLSDTTTEKQEWLEQQYQELLRQAEHIDEFGEDEDSFDFGNGGREGKRAYSFVLLVWLNFLSLRFRLGRCR